MPRVKISNLPNTTSVNGSELIPFVQDGITKRISIKNLADSGLFASGSSTETTTSTVRDITPGATVQIPDLDVPVNRVKLDRNMTIQLPLTSSIPDGHCVTFNIRIDQASGSFTLAFTGSDRTITWDNPSWVVPGAGKTAIFSFMAFAGDTFWLASQVWLQA